MKEGIFTKEDICLFYDELASLDWKFYQEWLDSYTLQISDQITRGYFNLSLVEGDRDDFADLKTFYMVSMLMVYKLHHMCSLGELNDYCNFILSGIKEVKSSNFIDTLEAKSRYILGTTRPMKRNNKKRPNISGGQYWTLDNDEILSTYELEISDESEKIKNSILVGLSEHYAFLLWYHDSYFY